MKRARAKEVLYDSATVLRLVDRELQELRDDGAVGPSPSHAVTPATDAAPAPGDKGGQVDRTAAASPRAPRRRL